MLVPTSFLEIFSVRRKNRLKYLLFRLISGELGFIIILRFSLSFYLKLICLKENLEIFKIFLLFGFSIF